MSASTLLSSLMHARAYSAARAPGRRLSGAAAGVWSRAQLVGWVLLGGLDPAPTHSQHVATPEPATSLDLHRPPGRNHMAPPNASVAASGARTWGGADACIRDNAA